MKCAAGFSPVPTGQYSHSESTANGNHIGTFKGQRAVDNKPEVTSVPCHYLFKLGHTLSKSEKEACTLIVHTVVSVNKKRLQHLAHILIISSQATEVLLFT